MSLKSDCYVFTLSLVCFSMSCSLAGLEGDIDSPLSDMPVSVSNEEIGKERHVAKLFEYAHIDTRTHLAAYCYENLVVLLAQSSTDKRCCEKKI